MKMKENDAKQYQNQNVIANITEFRPTTKIYITHVFFLAENASVFCDGRGWNVAPHLTLQCSTQPIVWDWKMFRNMKRV